MCLPAARSSRTRCNNALALIQACMVLTSQMIAARRDAIVRVLSANNGLESLELRVGLTVITGPPRGITGNTQTTKHPNFKTIENMFNQF
jgi:hypothetical protein